VSKPLVQILLISAIVLLFSDAALAESSLTLSSTTATAGSSVTLDLSLASPSGSEPAALQWTLDYPAAGVARISVTAGLAATAAGKSISCAGDSTAYICIVSGLNGNTIGNGRRVSSNLRHPVWEFSDYLPLNSGRMAPAC
jgi:hypothetical protein